MHSEEVCVDVSVPGDVTECVWNIRICYWGFESRWQRVCMCSDLGNGQKSHSEHVDVMPGSLETRGCVRTNAVSGSLCVHKRVCRG